jgi:hypothetical protein
LNALSPTSSGIRLKEEEFMRNTGAWYKKHILGIMSDTAIKNASDALNGKWWMYRIMGEAGGEAVINELEHDGSGSKAMHYVSTATGAVRTVSMR